VVRVPVRQQDGGRAERVLREDLGEALLDPDPRVDDDALLARGRGDHVAVRPEGEGGEADDQHGPSLDGGRGVLPPGAAPGLDRRRARLD
jgi:hypothetical protein